ncbi:uncharacterized protein [Physcomitrium patens]|uniref:Uncharacterized protein n=1 Tax=Physcomitrium patens TaxID=3218 RepID=A0A2K1ING4_PHYPA|nr:uncharacterized protein LOC112275292 [Physcomitrium patens]PNR30810.1 hypothetical protein PHYPA_027126 [Physcomitrium patens]|eukprot:XP_024361301.1 uncharacterized protein LOC112275292 [Physcomitrella patens]
MVLQAVQRLTIATPHRIFANLLPSSHLSAPTGCRPTWTSETDRPKAPSTCRPRKDESRELESFNLNLNPLDITTHKGTIVKISAVARYGRNGRCVPVHLLGFSGTR